MGKLEISMGNKNHKTFSSSASKIFLKGICIKMRFMRDFKNLILVENLFIFFVWKEIKNILQGDLRN